MNHQKYQLLINMAAERTVNHVIRPRDVLAQVAADRSSSTVTELLMADRDGDV